MTQKVNPSINRPIEAFKTAGAIALAGGSENGWISDSSNPSDISVQDTGISEGQLNAFSVTTSTSSLDVTIDGGEAFIYGSWLVKDTTTTVSLSSSTTDQTVYIGWDKDGTNQVIIGLSSAFQTAAGNTDERIPLYSFDTDSTGVTSNNDLRGIGKTISQSKSIDSNETIQLPDDYSLTTSGVYRNDGSLVVNGSFTSTGPIVGTGSISGDGSVGVSDVFERTIEPINPTINSNIFVALSGWRTDNDGNSYDAYRFGRDSSIEIEKEEALTLERQ
jgi:hypothetical protein